ncbi:MAG TPA: ATP-binding cassette domain-containing protein [Gemmatimonadales bacterium]|nr:ATP-binding cassette domain-containing protein [Gemmatimonadales bacterium]
MTLSLQNITKSFSAVRALAGVDLVLRPGEVHAVLGENGAGKSTLMRIANGLLRPDAGTISVDGVTTRFRSARDARRRGIGMVHQHSTAVPALSVMENIALAAGWPVAPAALRRRVEDLTARLSLPLDPSRPASHLSVALKQRLEIVKALASGARILLLDEPTAVLAPAEADELLGFVRGLARAGGAVVLITHKLDEALGVADRITVLRQGRVVRSALRPEFTAAELTTAMIGGEVAVAPRVRKSTDWPVLIRCDALEVARESGTGLRQASFSVRGGELVAVAGIEGNGQRELLRAVAGLRRPFRGLLEVSRPVAFIPEDRSTEGLIPSLTLTENVVLGVGRAASWIVGRRVRRVDWPAARRRTAELLARFGVRAAGSEAPAGSLSGGNQQKLLVARALERRPRVLVAENPTRGLDLQAAADIHARLRAAAAAGAAVLVYSNDLDEVVELGDRVLVAFEGVVAEAPAGADRQAIGAMLLGQEPPRAG